MTRYSPYLVSVLGCAASVVFTATLSAWWVFGVAGFGALTLLGTWDLVQRQHSITRNYPIAGHLRFLAEALRPEVHQYFVESNTDGKPYSRDRRSLIYKRSKNLDGMKPFGTELDVYSQEYEWFLHTIAPKPRPTTAPRTLIGGKDCTRPYSASLLNVSAMSFGALSGRAVEALNLGAKLGGYFQNTGEGGCSKHHLKHGGDICWQIASGYFGCRRADGTFDPERFKAMAAHESIKMIELKLSQGAKPGHGGVLPAAKVTPEIAEARGVPLGEDCVSPAAHSAFRTPREMCEFIGELRALSGGKPVGFKLCVGHKSEFLAVCKAMLETGLKPDFVVVDGGEGGTGAAPLEFSNSLGTPLAEGLWFVHNALVGAGLRQELRVGASGKVHSAASMAKCLALGADWCNAARAFMMSVGCLQSQRCDTNQCPVGVATQDKTLQLALNVALKSERARNLHDNTVKALSEITAAAGLEHPCDFQPIHLYRRDGDGQAQCYADVLSTLEPGELLAGARDAAYRRAWDAADPDAFNPMVGASMSRVRAAEAREFSAARTGG